MTSEMKLLSSPCRRSQAALQHTQDCLGPTLAHLAICLGLSLA